MNVIFFGSSHFVLPVLEELFKFTTLSLVITTEQKQTDPVVTFCKEKNIHCLSVETLSDQDLKSKILNLKSPVGILASFGLFVPQEILGLFPYGIINIHPSLLPQYRGPTPVQTALLNGDIQTGATIIKLDNQLDHGPILAQAKTEIRPDETAETLHLRLFEQGAKLLKDVLPRYLNDSIKLQEQDDAKATFTKPLTRADGYIDLSNIKPARMNRMIRAYYPWPGVWSELTVNSRKTRIKFLPNKRIQIEGKRPMSYKDFKNGYPELTQQLQKVLEA